MRSPSLDRKRAILLRKEEAAKLEKVQKEKDELEKRLKNLKEERELDLEHGRVLQRQQEIEQPSVLPIQNILRYWYTLAKHFLCTYSSGNLKPVF